jgi:protease-4
MQSAIDRIYADFIANAAAARKTTPEKIDLVAQGRVWTGDQAKERGLVDRTGSYLDALAAARARAKLGADAPVNYIEAEAGRFERIVEMLGSSVARSLGLPTSIFSLQPGIPAGAVREAQQELGWLADVAARRQPFAAVVHCLCEPPR